MSEAATRRGIVALGIFFVAAMILLLLGHHALTGYLEKHPAGPSAAPPVAGELSGTVRLSDGSPASSARVVVEWRDASGRSGETPAVPGDDGRFRAAGLPAHAKVERVTAWIGPLAATGGAAAGAADLLLPKEFSLRGRVRASPDRAPVAGARLSLAGVTTTADEGGEFRLERVPAAAALSNPVLSVEADGFKPLDWPLSKDDPPETYQDLTVRMERSK